MGPFSVGSVVWADLCFVFVQDDLAVYIAILCGRGPKWVGKSTYPVYSYIHLACVFMIYQLTKKKGLWRKKLKITNDRPPPSTCQAQ